MAKQRTDAERRARQCERLARLLRVLQIILGPGKNDAKRIAKELECSERTVYRDLQVLSVAGVPWFFDESDQSYRVRPGFRFPALPSNQVESSPDLCLGKVTPAELAEVSLIAVRQISTNLSLLEDALVRLRNSLSESPSSRKSG